MDTKTITTYIVDSFTNEIFKGNPAAVCLLDNEISETLMLSIAKEFNLSETAFVQKLDKNNTFSIRFFSPKIEIPLCGHATLAASKVLFEKNPGMDQIHFINIQQLDLMIKKAGEMITMEFPVYDTKPVDVPLVLLDALGITNIAVVNTAYNEETNIILIEIDNCLILRSLHPNFEALLKSHDTINGVLVTATSDKKDFDFESRYFWPWSGTNEDPVTGGTHTFLTKYWGKRLDKQKMRSYQCSERSGFMEVELISSDKFTITSTARIFFEGELSL